jgi:hypothetical protein|tara:strand:- start:106 stop:315 length:210 start_codon:yes stop_codon:yes gene_type:complete
MKLKEYLKEEEVSQKFFLEMLANEGIKISKVAFWKWLSGETYPTVDKLLVIQKLTDDKVQAEDWVDGKV